MSIRNYNQQYARIIKNIKMLKASHANNDDIQSSLESLIKELDQRYIDEQYLDEIEIKVNSMMNTKYTIKI